MRWLRWSYDVCRFVNVYVGGHSAYIVLAPRVNLDVPNHGGELRVLAGGKTSGNPFIKRSGLRVASGWCSKSFVVSHIEGG